MNSNSKSKQKKRLKKDILHTTLSSKVRSSQKRTVTTTKKNTSRKQTTISSSKSPYIIQIPTKQNAIKILKMVLNIKHANPMSLTTNEISKLCESELFPLDYRKKFTVSGFMTNCMFLKNTFQNKRIFDTCVNLFPIIYGKSLTKDDIKNIKMELRFFFNNNDDRVQEIMGGVNIGGVNGRQGFYLIFLAFMDIGLISNLFLLQFYKGSLVLGIDQCVTDLSKLVTQFDVNVLATSGKTMDHYHQKIRGENYDPSTSILGKVLDSTSWFIYSKKERSTASFKENQNRIIKYVQLGVHGITSSVDFGDHYWRERYDFENQEDIQYRADTKAELKKVGKATKMAKRIVDDEAKTIEVNKVYTEESIEDLKNSIIDIIDLDEQIQTIMKSTEKTNKKVIEHEKFLSLIELMDIKFGVLQDYRLNLELRPPPAECKYQVAEWNDVRTVDDYLSFATETFVGNMKQIQQIISNAVAYQTNLIKQITKDMFEIYQNVWNVIEDIQVIFIKARELTSIDLPTQYTLMVFLWKKLSTVFPLIIWYIVSFFAFIGGIVVNVCTVLRRPRQQIQNNEQHYRQQQIEQEQEEQEQEQDIVPPRLQLADRPHEFGNFPLTAANYNF